MILVLLLLSLFLGIFIIYLLAPAIPGAARWTLAATLALVLHALFYFWLLLARVDFNKVLLATSAAGFILFFAMLYRKKTIPWHPTGWSPGGLFLVLLVLAAWLNYLEFSVPWGEWDGWAIWNPHARFLYFTDRWRMLFSGEYSGSHPDYPLMLPSLIAMFWKAAGNMHFMVPVIIGALPLAGIMVLLFSACKDLHAGIFAAVIIAVDNHFIAQAASQYADVLLAFFCLLTVVMISMMEDAGAGKAKLPFFLGFVAASCIWVKNEGMVFFIISSLCSFALFRKEPGFLWKYASGFIPVLLTWVVFKLFLAPPNDLVSGLSFKTIHKILDPGRYVILAASLARVVLTEYLLLPTVLFFLLVRWRSLPGSVFMIGATFLVYLAAYVVTPHDLKWHLETSLNRLILHLYPAVLFIFAGMLSGLKNDTNPFLLKTRNFEQP
jgi:hypothetical protein